MRATPTADEWEPIANLPEAWPDLRRDDLQVVHQQWKAEKAILKDPEKIQKLEEALGTAWAIETGIIERLYVLDRGITETLIELGLEHLHQFHQRGAVSQDAVRLIEDQREALEFVFQFVRQERELTLSYIKELHQLLTRHQETSEAVDPSGKKVRIPLLRGDWKKQGNNPTLPDGRVHEYCPTDFVQDEMEQLLSWHNDHVRAGVSVEVEAAWLHHRFTQIHPFQDGNGRIARALATIVFLRAEYLPLVIRDTEHREKYLDALSQADVGELGALVGLFADIQIRDMSNAIQTLRELRGEGISKIASSAAQRVKVRQLETEQEVEQLTERLLSVTQNRLEEIRAELELSFHQEGIDIEARVLRNSPDTATWWNYQIIETAKHFGYRADLTRYRAWTQLRLRLDALGITQTNVIVSFHHKGAVPGLMVTTVFLSTSTPDSGDDGAREELEVIPVADAPFTYSTTHRDPERDFRSWLDGALERALGIWQARI